MEERGKHSGRTSTVSAITWSNLACWVWRPFFLGGSVLTLEFVECIIGNIIKFKYCVGSVFSFRPAVASFLFIRNILLYPRTLAHIVKLAVLCYRVLHTSLTHRLVVCRWPSQGLEYRRDSRTVCQIHSQSSIQMSPFPVSPSPSVCS